MLEDELRKLIIEKYGSIRQFALKIDIPYTTLDSILKRGIDNSNVGNAIKICKALNISVDNLLDNKKIVSDIETDDIGKDNTNDLSLLEQYHILFDKDSVLTEEQKKFFIDFLTEKHKEIDKKTGIE